MCVCVWWKYNAHIWYNNILCVQKWHWPQSMFLFFVNIFEQQQQQQRSLAHIFLSLLVRTARDVDIYTSIRGVHVQMKNININKLLYTRKLKPTYTYFRCIWVCSICFELYLFYINFMYNVPWNTFYRAFAWWYAWDARARVHKSIILVYNFIFDLTNVPGERYKKGSFSLVKFKIFKCTLLRNNLKKYSDTS